MWYFAGADSRDPGIAPLVIESMQAMEDDRDRTFAWICLKQLVQTDETSERILQELKALRSSGDESDHYRHTVASALLAANPSFLASNKRKILPAMPELDPSCKMTSRPGSPIGSSTSTIAGIRSSIWSRDEYDRPG